MTPWDTVALSVFFACWLGFEPILQRMGRKSGSIIQDMSVLRLSWMIEMARRDSRIIDNQVLGNVLHTTTFLTSSNIILMAAIAGVVFHRGEGQDMSAIAAGISGGFSLFQMKLGLVILCLGRGFLDYIWALKQFNYCVVAIASVPEKIDNLRRDLLALALNQVLSPAMKHFSQGIRAYYFALAAAAWVIGPLPFLLMTLTFMLLLAWRQMYSGAASGLHEFHRILEDAPARDE